MLIERDLLIAGDWIAASEGERFATRDPATGEVIGVCADATEADVDSAVQAARAAFADPTWRELAPAARARMLWRLADLVDAHADELARLDVRDQGQPYTLARAVNVALAAEQLRYNAGWCTKLAGETPPVSVPNTFQYTRREPLGVCALIPTWNFPLMGVAGKVAPALAVGNTVVVKPSEHTPLTALRFGELALEAGVPPGVVNVVTGGARCGRALVAHPGVDAVSFTGSTAVGREILRSSADGLQQVTLELGGKAPSIIAPDADLEAAVAANGQAALINSGQVCAAYTRFYVHRRVAAEFTERLATWVDALKLGPGMEASTQLGPLVSPGQVDRVEGYVAQGLAQGAELVTGGSRPEGLGRGNFYRPTILAGVADAMDVAREEIFGPVLAVLTYDDLEELPARANDSPYGLAASVWTRDVATAHRLAHALDAGSVFVNMLPLLDVAAPWGGFKASGIGKEMGRSGVEHYSREKSVWISLGSQDPPSEGR